MTEQEFKDILKTVHTKTVNKIRDGNKIIKEVTTEETIHYLREDMYELLKELIEAHPNLSNTIFKGFS